MKCQILESVPGTTFWAGNSFKIYDDSDDSDDASLQSKLEFSENQTMMGQTYTWDQEGREGGRY